MFAVAIATPAHTQAQPVDQDLVHAAYVVNFLRYSEWPERDAERTDGEVTVLVVGPSRVARAMRRVAEGAGASMGRPIRVRSIRPDPSGAGFHDHVERYVRTAHAVFVADTDPQLVGMVLGLSHLRPVLTVGIGEEFVRAGGMLALIRDGRNVTFTTNEHAIRTSPVTVSSRVLKIARPLNPEPRQDGELARDRSTRRIALLRSVSGDAAAPAAP